MHHLISIFLTLLLFFTEGNLSASTPQACSAPLGDLCALAVNSFPPRRTTPDGKTIDLTYNPDGHRLSKFITQNGLTQRLVHYLTDANNSTGYAQVIEEKEPLEASNQQLKKVNLYGHDLISSSVYQPSTLNHQLLYYSYDGLGSVRSISNATGDLQETYDYDAYGTLIGLGKRNPVSGQLESTDLTNLANKPTSEFLYTGEQWDADLGMYFLRARYLNTNTGRFYSQDSYEGQNGEPLTLHKYLYAHGNPVMFTDPSGEFSLGEMSQVTGNLVRSAGQAFQNIAQGFIRQLKTRIWTVEKIRLAKGFPYFEHTFIWAKKRASRIGIGYHVFSTPDYLNPRSASQAMKRSRDYNILVDGIFAILPQESPDSLLGIKLKVASKELVTLMTSFQFVVWNIWASQSMAAFYLAPQGKTYPYKYNVDTTDCMSWSDEAERKARVISLLPF